MIEELTQDGSETPPVETSQSEVSTENQGEKNKEPVLFKKKEDGFWARWFAPLKSKKPRTDNKFFGFMQRLGGTFMLPIAVMSIGGLLLGIGSGLQGIVTEEMSKTGYQILGYLAMGGQLFFTLMPVSFTIAIPVGLCTNNAGSAAFAAVIAHFGVFAGMNFLIPILQNNAFNVYDFLFNSGGVTNDLIKLEKPILGFEHVMDMSVLGAIINGIIIWKLNERFQYQKLPTFISYLGGKRLTPVLAILIFPTMGMAWVFIWPWFAKGLYFAGLGLQYTGDFGPGIHIFVSRLLCPTGLHHMVNQLIGNTAVGGIRDVIDPGTGDFWVNPTTGEIAKGLIGTSRATNAYMSIGKGYPHNLSRWFSGAYNLPALFGLPAAAIAIYVCGRKNTRPVIKGAIISGILATMGGSITETIEFLFLFTAPLLYLFHSFMVGVGYVVYALCDSKIVTGGDIPTFIIYGPLQGWDSKWWLTLICGPIDAAIYFVVFYFSIKKFNIKTIGREDEGTAGKGSSAMANILDTGAVDKKKDSKVMRDANGKKIKVKKVNVEAIAAQGYLELLGGWENINQLTNCFSRLRVTLHQPKEIGDAEVKALGGIGVKKISDINYQIVCGAQVEAVRNEMEKLK